MGEMLPSPLKTVTRPPDTAPRRKGMPRVHSRVRPQGGRRARPWKKVSAVHPSLPMHVCPAGHGFNCDERGSYCLG